MQLYYKLNTKQKMYSEINFDIATQKLSKNQIASFDAIKKSYHLTSTFFELDP